jgi:aspartate/tyrosine/aromatic aminotransferase
VIKNFGLYGERVGTLSVVCRSKDEADRLLSQVGICISFLFLVSNILIFKLKILVRTSYSNPPIYGARIVAAILSDQELKNQWVEDCKGMAERFVRFA